MARLHANKSRKMLFKFYFNVNNNKSTRSRIRIARYIYRSYTLYTTSLRKKQIAASANRVIRCLYNIRSFQYTDFNRLIASLGCAVTKTKSYVHFSSFQYHIWLDAPDLFHLNRTLKKNFLFFMKVSFQHDTLRRTFLQILDALQIIRFAEIM